LCRLPGSLVEREDVGADSKPPTVQSRMKQTIPAANVEKVLEHLMGEEQSMADKDPFKL
jgi:hypothetical protein